MPTRQDLYDRLHAAREALVPLINSVADTLPMPDCLHVLEELGTHAQTIGAWCSVVAEGIRKHGPHSGPVHQDKQAIDNVAVTARDMAARLRTHGLDIVQVERAVARLTEVDRTASAIVAILDSMPEPDIVRRKDVVE